MSTEMKKHVIDLLATYHDRERQIALLHYELEHPGKVSGTEQIDSMSYAHGDGLGQSKGHISNKTLYIALNYEEQAERLNSATISEIANELFELEQRQKKLQFYVALLEKRQAEVIRLLYVELVSPKKVADILGVAYRTVERIKKGAIENLAAMYAYSDRFSE